MNVLHASFSDLDIPICDIEEDIMYTTSIVGFLRHQSNLDLSTCPDCEQILEDKLVELLK